LPSELCLTLCSDNGELPLPKPLRSAILTRNRRISGECLLRAIFTTIGIGSVEFLRLEGLSLGPEAVARALDHASSGWNGGCPN
jgi:hypothetical protein